MAATYTQALLFAGLAASIAGGAPLLAGIFAFLLAMGVK